jgi:hypothetical protein
MIKYFLTNKIKNQNLTSNKTAFFKLNNLLFWEVYISRRGNGKVPGRY